MSEMLRKSDFYRNNSVILNNMPFNDSATDICNKCDFRKKCSSERLACINFYYVTIRTQGDYKQKNYTPRGLGDYKHAKDIPTREVYELIFS